MKQKIHALLAAEGITEVALLPFEECAVTREDLIADGFSPRCAILFLMPYYAGKPQNFSAYAAAEDYHFFVREMAERLRPALREAYPDATFCFYADHAPIDERQAAVRAGLGVYGKNGLLLNEATSSYHFIGEILTDLPPESLGTAVLYPPASCIGCGACLAACPTGILRGEGSECLSAITQKKGELTADEMALLKKHNTAWGCDICQEVCPYTHRAIENGTIYTAIPFFLESRIERLDTATLASLDNAAFRRRAFAWRGRKTVERNVRILEEK